MRAAALRGWSSRGLASFKGVTVENVNLRETTNEFTRSKNPDARYWKSRVYFAKNGCWKTISSIDDTIGCLDGNTNFTPLDLRVAMDALGCGVAVNGVAACRKALLSS